MKNYVLFTLFGAFVLLLSACSSESGEIVSETKILRNRPTVSEKVLRNTVSIKNTGERVEKRAYTFYTNAHQNLLDRYGIKTRTETFLGESQKDLLVTPRRTSIDYDMGEPVRMSSFLNSPVAYSGSSYYKDPTEKKVLGVTYNTREGYLRTAKIDQKGYQKGYIESMQEKEESVGSSNTDNSENAVEDKNNADNFFYGPQKGYIEAYTDKYGSAPKPYSGNYIKDNEEQSGNTASAFYSSNNYLSELPNGRSSEGAKNYLESLSDEEVNFQKGYLENTFVSDFGDDGVFNEGNWQRKGSYLDNVAWTSPQSGYLENLGYTAPASRGYIESMAVFGQSPNISTYGF